MGVEKESYYRNKYIGMTQSTIKSTLMTDKDCVVYGARAINAQLPQHLQKQTNDWDIYDREARSLAYRIEKTLDNRYGGNYFEVKLAKHKGTFRVISRISGEVVADVTVNTTVVPYRVIGGIKYATLDFHVKRIKVILKDRNLKYRHAKDSEALQRINISRRRRYGAY